MLNPLRLLQVFSAQASPHPAPSATVSEKRGLGPPWSPLLSLPGKTSLHQTKTEPLSKLKGGIMGN